MCSLHYFKLDISSINLLRDITKTSNCRKIMLNSYPSKHTTLPSSTPTGTLNVALMRKLREMFYLMKIQVSLEVKWWKEQVPLPTLGSRSLVSLWWCSLMDFTSQ